MNRIRLAVASLNQTPLDWDGNRDRILAAIDATRAANASLLCLPELCIPGYGSEDAFMSAALHRESLTVLHELLPHTEQMAVIVGLPMAWEGEVYNAGCLISTLR